MHSSKFSLIAVSLLVMSVANATPVDYAHLPLAFEGLPDGQKYLARSAGLTVAVGPNGASIQSGKGKDTPKRILLRFLGASTQPKAEPADRLPGVVNYFIGSDPRRWRSAIPTYGRVQYAGVFPGVDVVYYGSGAQLEYDFRVAAGADPGRIRMMFDGARRPTVAFDGGLIVGDLRQHRPIAYQTSGTQRIPVDCRYEITRDGEVAFALGSYDRHLPLVIDPVLSYSTYIGGSVNDGVTSVKVDASGNIYLAGFSSSPNFPMKGATQPAYGGTNSPLLQGQFGDAFVAKLAPGGNSLVYSTYLGGSGDDFATGIAIDAGGNAYISGNTQSANFPVSAGALQRVYKGFAASDDNGFYDPGDGFVAKLDPTGGKLLYATYLGGSLNDLALGIAVDTAGRAIVVGTTNSTDFPTTPGSLYPQFRGATGFGPGISGDGFISILTADGTALAYSTFFGGSGHDGISAVALDSANNIFVTGMTFSSDLPVTTGAAQTIYHGRPVTHDGFTSTAADSFAAKISPQGKIVYCTYLGGGDYDAGSAIAVDTAGSAIVTGETMSTDFPVTTPAAQPGYNGSGAVGTIGDAYGGDAFVTKIKPDGSGFSYSTYLGGTGDEAGLGVAVDASGDIFVTGFTLSSNFPTTGNALQGANAGFGGQGLAPNPDQGFDSERARNTGDAFLTEFASNGELLYSSFFGGASDDAGVAIALDMAGNPVIAGSTLSAAIPGSAAGFQPAFGGSGPQWPRGDGFIARFNFGGKVVTAASITMVAGFSGAGAPSATLTTPFVVQVTDSTGAPVPNLTVAFSATGATVNPATSVTDAQGHASTTVTLGPTAGAGSITATVAGLAPLTVPLTIAAAATEPVVQSVVNGASFQSPISPGSWITVFIDRTAASPSIAYQAPLPSALGGFSIQVNGTAIPIYAATPLSPSGTQLNAQLPYEIPSGTAQLVVTQGTDTSAPFPITVQTTAPGIFLFGNNRAVAQNVAADGTLTVNTADNPVPAGQYIIVYLTGQGPLNNPVPTGGLATSTPLSKATSTYSATLNGTSLPIDFLGMTPGEVALAQANIRIPAGTAPGSYQLSITVGSSTSNAATISVTNPLP